MQTNETMDHGQQAWVFAGLERSKSYDGTTQWVPRWVQVEEVRGDMDKIVVKREDGMLAVVRSFKIHHGNARCDHPGWSAPTWFTEEELVYA